MSDFQAIADRVEIEALRGEFTDAVMMRDYDRGASLFTHDGVLRMPNVPVELAGREQIRAGGERLQGLWDYFVQNTHPGHDPAGRRHRVRPRLHARARTPPRRQLAPELRHLPRPLSAHRRRLEVHRTRLRGPLPRHQPASGLGAGRRGRPVNLRLVEAAGPGVVRNVTDIAQFPLARVIAVVSSVPVGSSPTS